MVDQRPLTNEERASRESLRVELDVLTPIHIGTREGRLTSLDFVQMGGCVHIVDEDKFCRFLMKRGLLDLFVQEVRKGPLRMERFLKETANIPLDKIVPQIISRSLPGGGPGMYEFRPFVRDALGRLFLPGSSIKGALRTAVLYKMLKEDPKKKDSVIANVRNKLRGRIRQKEKVRFSADWLQKEYLQSFPLPKGKPGPNEDIMRCLSVGDAYPVNGAQTRVIQIRFLCKTGEGGHYWSQRKGRDGRPTGTDLTLWLETLVTGTFSTVISWDRRLASHFFSGESHDLPVKSLKDVLRAVREMTSDLVEHEQKFFSRTLPKDASKSSYRDVLRQIDRAATDPAGKAASSLFSWYKNVQGDLFRLGFGSGMLSTTINLHLPMELRQQVRDRCGSGRRPGDPAPKSRRVWRKSAQDCLPLGWFRLRIGE